MYPAKCPFLASSMPLLKSSSDIPTGAADICHSPLCPSCPHCPLIQGAPRGQAMCPLPLTELGTGGEHLRWVTTPSWMHDDLVSHPPPPWGTVLRAKGTGADSPYHQDGPPQPPDRHYVRHSPTDDSSLPGGDVLPVSPDCGGSSGWLSPQAVTGHL